MLKFNKCTIKEIVIIVICSAVLAILYNSIRTDSLPFVPKSQAERMVSDTALFGPDRRGLPDAETPSAVALNEKSVDSSANDKSIEGDIPAPQSTSSGALVPSEQPSRADTAGKVDFDAILAVAKRSSFGDYKVVDYQQMRRIADDKSGRFVIVDARRAEPYSKRHIGNAINICPYDSADVVMNKVANLPSGKTIIVYCDGGNCDSSHEIANILQAMGFDKFYIYEGGWEEWEKK